MVPLRCRLPQTATGTGMQGFELDTSRKSVRLRITKFEVQILTGVPPQTLIPQQIAGFLFCGSTRQNAVHPGDNAINTTRP